jgi:hypothetical protein
VRERESEVATTHVPTGREVGVGLSVAGGCQGGDALGQAATQDRFSA